MSIRIVLADDHKMILAALRSLLEKENDIAVVGDAADGTALLELVERTAPDIAVVDIGMPGINGIEATRRLLAARPLLKVIALSAYTDKRFVLEMMEAGARGYLVKASAGEELPRAIRTIAQGQTYLSPEVAGAVVDEARGHGSIAGHAPAKLGPRERQVLTLLADGNSSSEIGAQLHISVSTVEVHRRNIMRKLNLHGIAELTKYAIREGLTSP
ncbi:MAG: DNA-binding response regulator [Betaproteobacteria bacterium RIFCSPLOWO2_12_FULL_63_13]|nr:MAG: DNA-binding response regulator [Betaproteobacteria bacterium RIFCSPLOWO2_02_FULL_63_19]OGA51846.1 MAG: DNA-binding response regulator [Betaproteobacteria bacterium RIFCSPLOWO2_12_FULL_63_13]